jgi:hypothetical protein
VLVISFRGGWLLHGTWEALIAEALRRRGARPTLFLCSGGLPQALPGKAPACGIAGFHVSSPVSCHDCLRCGLAVGRALDLPAIRLSEVVDTATAKAVMASVDDLDRERLLRLRHRDWPIGEFVANSARWFLCVSNLDAAPEGEAVFRAFAKSAMVLAEAAPALLDRAAPDVVLLLSGLFFAERIIKAEAERRGLRVITYERGFEPDTLCFSEGFANYYVIDPLWEEVKDTPLSEDQEARLDEYLTARHQGLRAPFNYWPTITKEEKDVLLALKLDRRRPTATLFTNITWDAAAQDRDRAFRDMLDWVVATIRYFAEQPEAQLVIRVHPAEVRAVGWETRDPLLSRLRTGVPSLPPNVRVVPPESDISSYTLMALSRCGLVYTSTTGLEMAMDGMPVVVAGDVHYSGKGFTLDAVDPANYARLLTAALNGSREAATRALARRYAYALFFRYFHPFPMVSENAPDFMPTLLSEDPRILDPGHDPTLDLVCQSILNGGGFFAPP